MAHPKTNIEKHRRLNFLSQTEVAHHLGITQVGYSKIERGERRLTIDVARKLVKLFKLDHIEDLLDDEEETAAS